MIASTMHPPYSRDTAWLAGEPSGFNSSAIHTKNLAGLSSELPLLLEFNLHNQALNKKPPVGEKSQSEISKALKLQFNTTVRKTVRERLPREWRHTPDNLLFTKTT